MVALTCIIFINLQIFYWISKEKLLKVLQIEVEAILTPLGRPFYNTGALIKRLV